MFFLIRLEHACLHKPDGCQIMRFGFAYEKNIFLQKRNEKDVIVKKLSRKTGANARKRGKNDRFCREWFQAVNRGISSVCAKVINRKFSKKSLKKVLTKWLWSDIMTKLSRETARLVLEN